MTTRFSVPPMSPRASMPRSFAYRLLVPLLGGVLLVATVQSVDAGQPHCASQQLRLARNYLKCAVAARVSQVKRGDTAAKRLFRERACDSVLENRLAKLSLSGCDLATGEKARGGVQLLHSLAARLSAGGHGTHSATAEISFNSGSAGAVSAWGLVGEDGVVEAVGVTMDATVMVDAQAPPLRHPGHGGPSAVIVDFPHVVKQQTFFDHLGLDWTDQGHTPGIWSDPHYDVHLYGVDIATQDAVICPQAYPPGYRPGAPGPPDNPLLYSGGDYLPPAYWIPGNGAEDPSCNNDVQDNDETAIDCGGICNSCPPPGAPFSDYSDPALFPNGGLGSCVPQMGIHAADVREPELQCIFALLAGAPGAAPCPDQFTNHVIMGYIDGLPAFLEPMISQAYLQGYPSEEFDVPQPTKLGRATRWPTKGSLDYDSAADVFHLVFTEFVDYAE